MTSNIQVWVEIKTLTAHVPVWIEIKTLIAHVPVWVVMENLVFCTGYHGSTLFKITHNDIHLNKSLNNQGSDHYLFLTKC